MYELLANLAAIAAGIWIIWQLKELKTMVSTLREQVTEGLATIDDGLTEIADDLTGIGADVDSLLTQMDPGNQITPEIIASITAIRARMTTVKNAADAINAKVP